MKTIGAILKDDAKLGLNHSYFSEVLEAFKVVIEKNDMSLIFLNNDREREGAKSYIEQLREYGCVGCIIACTDDNPEIMEILDSDIPVAAVDKEYADAICVSSDNNLGMELMVNHLIEMGHKKIAFITGEDNEVTRIRFGAFKRVMERYHIPVNPEYIIQAKYRDMDLAIKITDELLKLKNPPTCIMFPDDYTSIGGINIINARGLNIPRDVSITGYDGNDILAQYEPRLTTVKQDTVGMGRIAAEKMIAQINNPSVSQAGMDIVTVYFVEGNTVRRIFE